MKKKKFEIETLFKWWPILAIIGGIIAFSSQLNAVWKSPAKIEEAQEEIDVTQKAIGDLSTNLNVYTAANEAANKQRDEQIKMFQTYLINPPDRRK